MLKIQFSLTYYLCHRWWPIIPLDRFVYVVLTALKYNDSYINITQLSQLMASAKKCFLSSPKPLILSPQEFGFHNQSGMS